MRVKEYVEKKKEKVINLLFDSSSVFLPSHEPTHILKGKKIVKIFSQAHKKIEIVKRCWNQE